MSSRGKRGPWWSWDGNQYTFNKPPRQGCFKSVKKACVIILITVAVTTYGLTAALTELL